MRDQRFTFTNSCKDLLIFRLFFLANNIQCNILYTTCKLVPQQRLGKYCFVGILINEQNRHSSTNIFVLNNHTQSYHLYLCTFFVNKHFLFSLLFCPLTQPIQLTESIYIYRKILKNEKKKIVKIIPCPVLIILIHYNLKYFLTYIYVDCDLYIEYNLYINYDLYIDYDLYLECDLYIDFDLYIDYQLTCYIYFLFIDIG